MINRAMIQHLPMEQWTNCHKKDPPLLIVHRAPPLTPPSQVSLLIPIQGILMIEQNHLVMTILHWQLGTGANLRL